MERLLRCRPLLVLAVMAAVVVAPATAPAAILHRGPWAVPAGAHRLGPLPARATVRAAVALAPRDPAALARYAHEVSTPGAPGYHRYLSVGQFAARFAPRAAQVAAVRASLGAHGLHTGALSANGLALAVTARAAVVQSAFATSLRRFALPDGRMGLATAGRPTVDPRIARFVQGVVGLSTVAPTAPRPHLVAHASPGAADCAGARSAAAADASYTTSQIAARYGLSSVYAAGLQGRHVTVAVYELEPFAPADIAAFQRCFHSTGALTTVRVDGGAGTGAGSGEAAMDIEDVLGLAPQADVRVYEGPASGVGAFDTYARIVSDDAAQVVTTSWGLCEADEGAGAARAESTLFQEAAVQGQTILASTGDQGADDCGARAPAVDDPASQPWVTGVGATSLSPARESVWNNAYGATGGGVSRLWGRPAYQASAALPQTAVSCATAGGACREVPDVAAAGDPNTGYVVRYNGSWVTMGGTSISTPTWAAVVALADSSPACAGRPVGFANPALYGLAATAYPANFGDVTLGSNGFDRVPGFAAGPGYDMASGLGTPDARSLVPALCGDGLTLVTPAAQSVPAGQAQRLALSATSSSGAAVTYAASGLPPGLAVAGAAITGAPTASGRYTVTVTATDAAGATAWSTFPWTVTGPRAQSTAARSARPAITLAALRDRVTTVGSPIRLRIQARDGRGLALRYTASRLPRGLRLDPGTGIITGHPLRAGDARVTVRVTDSAGATARAVFRWRIRPAGQRV